MRAIGSDLTYRMRMKKCSLCRGEFRSVELSESELWAVIKEATRLEADFQEIEAVNIELRAAVNLATLTLAPLATKSRRRRRPPSTK
jgi:hypothetical protein